MMKEKMDLFWKLVEPEHKAARAFCRKLMGNRDDGDDLYQDALVNALTGFSGLCEPTSFRAWLYRIMINTFKNKIRRRGILCQAALTNQIEESVGGDNPDPVYAARRRLDLAFKVLSAEDRALVALFELDGWSIAELAGIFGKKEANIKVRLSRARKKMHKVLTISLSLNEKGKSVQPSGRKDEICVAVKPGKN
ncbi:MAG: RNA polymerase sigma factor [Candidatus Zixiibacteriota bacterium]